MIERIRVVAGAAVTWLTFAATALTIFAEEIAAVFPDGGAEDATVWILRAVAWLGAAVAIIRRVTPVLPDQRGVLLPHADPPAD